VLVVVVLVVVVLVVVVPLPRHTSVVYGDAYCDREEEDWPFALLE